MTEDQLINLVVSVLIGVVIAASSYGAIRFLIKSYLNSLAAEKQEDESIISELE